MSVSVHFIFFLSINTRRRPAQSMTAVEAPRVSEGEAILRAIMADLDNHLDESSRARDQQTQRKLMALLNPTWDRDLLAAIIYSSQPEVAAAAAAVPPPPPPPPQQQQPLESGLTDMPSDGDDNTDEEETKEGETTPSPVPEWRQASHRNNRPARVNRRGWRNHNNQRRK